MTYRITLPPVDLYTSTVNLGDPGDLFNHSTYSYDPRENGYCDVRAVTSLVFNKTAGECGYD